MLPMELHSFVEFKATSLDTEYKWKHHCERTLGVHIDLVDQPSANENLDERRLAAEDERLLKWESLGRAAPRKDRAFFRKTFFMSNDLSGTSTSRVPPPQGEHVAAEERDFVGEVLASFEAASAFDDGGTAGKRRHPTKPHLEVEWSLPVLPEVELWANQYQFVTFDDDPGLKRAKLAEALIVDTHKAYNQRSSEAVLTASVVVPADVTSGEGEPSVYEWVRQYQIHLDKSTGDRGNFLFFIDEEKGVVTFKELNPQKVSAPVLVFVFLECSCCLRYFQLELRGGILSRRGEGDKYLVKRRELTSEEQKLRNNSLKVIIVGGSICSCSRSTVVNVCLLSPHVRALTHISQRTRLLKESMTAVKAKVKLPLVLLMTVPTKVGLVTREGERYCNYGRAPVHREYNSFFLNGMREPSHSRTLRL